MYHLDVNIRAMTLRGDVDDVGVNLVDWEVLLCACWLGKAFIVDSRQIFLWLIFAFLQQNTIVIQT